MTDKQTLKLSPIFNRCLIDLEAIGNFDFLHSDREQAMQVLMDTVDAAVNVVNNSPAESINTTDSGNVLLIQERIARIERGEKDPHVKHWDTAYYGDVYFLLGLLTRLRGKKMDSIDVEIGKLEDRVVEAAVAWKETFGAVGNERHWQEFSQSVDNLITARCKAEHRTTPTSC